MSVGARSGLFPKRSEISILFGGIGPSPVQLNGGLDVGTSLLQVPQLAKVTTKLEFDVWIFRKFFFGFLKDMAALLEGTALTHGIGKGNPGLGFLRAACPDFFGGFAHFGKATCGSQDPCSEKSQGQILLPFCFQGGDQPKGLIIHAQSAVSLQLFLQFCVVDHRLVRNLHFDG